MLVDGGLLIHGIELRDRDPDTGEQGGETVEGPVVGLKAQIGRDGDPDEPGARACIGALPDGLEHIVLDCEDLLGCLLVHLARFCEVHPFLMLKEQGDA